MATKPATKPKGKPKAAPKATKPKGLTIRAATDRLKPIGTTARTAFHAGMTALHKLCIALAEGEVVYAQCPALADKQSPNDYFRKCGVDLSDQGMNNMRAVGRVIRVIGYAKIHKTVAIDTLLKMHRLLTDTTVDLATRKQRVIQVWAAASNKEGFATAAQVAAVLNDRFPKVEGSRGPKAGTKGAAGNGRPKSRTVAPKPATAATPADSDFNRKGSRLALDKAIKGLDNDVAIAALNQFQTGAKIADKYSPASTLANIADMLKELRGPAKRQAAKSKATK